MSKTPLSRRTVLRGAGGYFIALPFLESMLAPLASAQIASTKRFVSSFAGTIVGGDDISGFSSYGNFPSTPFPPGWAALQAVRNHVSVISNLNIPTYNSGSQPTAPASAYNQQHGTTPSTLLAGITSKETMSVLVNGQTADQLAAAAIAGGTKFNSLQLRVQALPYSGSNNNHKGIMSAKVNNGVINSLPPLVSPQQIYQMLFSGVSAPSIGPVSSTPTPIDRKKSVLDLMLADANRLSASVSGKDKIRLEQHFDEIRAIERSLQNTTGGGAATGSCMKPTDPGADPALGANAFVGWSNETQRGNVMADMIAYAFACDLTRVVSWMLTFDQVFLRNALNNLTDMHDDSHDQSNRKAQIAASTNWHASLFARLVDNLSRMPEGSGTVLDNTFLSLVFAESKTAHSRTGMRHVVAGSGSYIKLGQHIDGGGDHPGKIQITGLQAVGVASNKLNELTGTLTPLLK